jgi:hypothetical protein
MSSDYRPRLSIEITQAQHNALQKHIPWGLKNQLFSTIIDELIPLLEKRGDLVIALIIDRKLKLDRILDIKTGDK